MKLVLLATTVVASAHLLARKISLEQGLIADKVAESLRLSQAFENVAEGMLDGPTKFLLQSFKICAKCSHFKRWGEAHDGGYLTCQDDLTSIKAAYSMGLEGHDKWSEDVYNALKIPVNQFDCTVQETPQKCPDCHFFRVCLSAPGGGGSLDNHTNWDLATVLEHTKQSGAADRSLIMKMDIECAEWPIFAAKSGNPLTKFQQISVEFHNIGIEGNHPQYLQAMQNILGAGFKVAHIHGNNCCGTYSKDGYSMPATVEVTFVAGTPALAQCQDPRRHFLDGVNLPELPALPDAHLP